MNLLQFEFKMGLCSLRVTSNIKSALRSRELVLKVQKNFVLDLLLLDHNLTAYIINLII